MKKFYQLLLCLLAVICLSGITQAKEPIRIGLSMDSLESQFWVSNYKAMVDEAKAKGVELITIMAEGDAVKQNQQIENLIAKGVDAIICAPKDGAAIAISVKRCKNAGIPIIMDNRPVQGKVQPDLSILSDNYAMSKDVLEWFALNAQKNGKKYKAILLIGNLGDENAVERKKGHKEIIEKYPDVFELVSEVPTEWNQEVAFKGLQNSLLAFPDANLIITPADIMFSPIKSALEQVGKWNKIGEDKHIAVVSFDGDEVGLQMLKDGYAEADAAQSAVATGKQCVDWAIKLANGEKPENPVIRDSGIIVNTENFAEIAPKVWSYSMLK